MMKYGNEPCQVGTEKYRSKRERNRHQELRMLEKAGKVRYLVREIPFIIVLGTILDGRRKPPIRYIADFVYDELKPDGSWANVVEDAKGVRTPVYRLKRHLMMVVHGIEVKET